MRHLKKEGREREEEYLGLNSGTPVFRGQKDKEGLTKMTEKEWTVTDKGNQKVWHSGQSQVKKVVHVVRDQLHQMLLRGLSRMGFR